MDYPQYIHSMASQQTISGSSGYDTAEEGSQRRRLERTPTSHASPQRYCPECNCYLKALSCEIMDLKEDNRCLRFQVVRESELQELARTEQYFHIDLQQKLDKTKKRHKAELNDLQGELLRLQKELLRLQTVLTTFDSENKSLQHQLQDSQMDNDELQKKLVHSQMKWQGLVDTGGLRQKDFERLKQQLSDSEKQRARTEQTMLTYKSLVSDITDEAEQLDGAVQQLQNSHTELRKTTFRAFCKVRPSLLDLHKVILNHIPNNGEHIQTWLEFFTALNMHHKDMPPLPSEWDARRNVLIVLDAWLKGVGAEPKTWGTLLNAMREKGTPFLRKLADAAEKVYLRKLASLHLPFDVCCVCWRDCSLATAAECSEAPI